MATRWALHRLLLIEPPLVLNPPWRKVRDFLPLHQYGQHRLIEARPQQCQGILSRNILEQGGEQGIVLAALVRNVVVAYEQLQSARVVRAIGPALAGYLRAS